jgi:hypothetical protein
VGLDTTGVGVSLKANCEPALPLLFVLFCELGGLVTAGVVGVSNALPVNGLIRGVELMLVTVVGGISLPANADPDPAEFLGVVVDCTPCEDSLVTLPKFALLARVPTLSFV